MFLAMPSCCWKSTNRRVPYMACSTISSDHQSPTSLSARATEQLESSKRFLAMVKVYSKRVQTETGFHKVALRNHINGLGPAYNSNLNTGVVPPHVSQS